MSNESSQLSNDDTVSSIISKFRQEHPAGDLDGSKVEGDTNNTEPLGDKNANTTEIQLKERSAVEKLIDAIKTPEIYNKYNNSLSTLEKWCLLSRSICYFLAAFFSGQGWNMAVFAFRLEQASEFLNKFIDDAVGVNKLVVNDLSQKILHAENNEERKEATRILEYIGVNFYSPAYLVSNLPEEIFASDAFIEIMKNFPKHRNSVIKNGLENLKRNEIPSEDFIIFLQTILEATSEEKCNLVGKILDLDVNGCLEQILFLQLNSKLKIINEEKNKDIPSLEFVNLLRSILNGRNEPLRKKIDFDPKEKLEKICDCVRNHLMFEEKTEDNKEITERCFKVADITWGKNWEIFTKNAVKIKQALDDSSPIIDKKAYERLENIFKECICTAISQYLQEKANNERGGQNPFDNVSTWGDIKHEWEEKQPKDIGFIKKIASAIYTQDGGNTSGLNDLCSKIILKEFPNALKRPENSDLLKTMAQLSKDITANGYATINIVLLVIFPWLRRPYEPLISSMACGENGELIISIENAYKAKHRKDGANEV